MEEHTTETEGIDEATAAPDPVEEPASELESVETEPAEEPTSEAELAEAEPPDEPVLEPEPEGAERGDELPAEAPPPGPTFGERLGAGFARAKERLGAAFARTRERLGAILAPAVDWLGAGLARVGGWLGGGNWVYGFIAALVIIALVLPPISLLQRLGLTGCARLNADNPSTSHPDGITVSIDPEEATTCRVGLSSVPQVDFLEGAAGSKLRAAVQVLPEVLHVKSPYYQIRLCSRSTGPATIEVVIPNDAEPWEALDLYTWDGETWEWVGGTLDAEKELLTAQVSSLPSSVVVVQTVPVVPTIGTVTAASLEGQAVEVLLTEVLLPGLYLGTDGALLGEVPPQEDGSPEPILLVRNWRDDQPMSLGLLADVLAEPGIQQAHIENLVTAAAGYAGVTIDYRGLAFEQQGAFSAFVAALAEALHEQALRLQVVVPAPTLAVEGWETGGYDWPALGAAADALLIPFPEDPAAYDGHGEVASLLRWAVGQVDRYKLRAVISSLSADAGPEGVRHVGLEEALAPFGQVHTDAQTPVEPGEEVGFTIAGQVTGMVRVEEAGTYAVSYRAEDETAHTVWLGTSSFLARKLDWALRYHLGGVVVADLTERGNFPGALDAVNGYRTAAGLAQPAELEVTWKVQGPDASVSEEVVSLSQPDFRWPAPSEPGAYTVSVAIAGVNQGSVQLTVAEPTSTPPPAAELLTEEEAACLRASFVADVTVPDGTHLDLGESFVKTWRLSNSGTCDWPENTVLAFASGSQMGGPDSVPVGALEVGEEVDISVDLVAPDSSDSFQGSWVLTAGGTAIAGGEVYLLVGVGDVVAAAPPPASVSAGSFELGGHVANMSFPYGDQMHYAGMNWAKVQVRYRGDPSGLIQAAHAHGFKIQVSALGPPNLVTQPGFEEDIASWVAAMAAAGADAIEIWNEPNIDREWQAGHIDPAAYTRLLCAAYNAIKAANPNTLVISAAPAPTGYFGGCSPLGCDDIPWIQGMYNAGAANCMDFIGAHHNAGATSPSARSGHPAGTHHSWYFLPQTEMYYNIFQGGRKLFYTEMGYVTPEGTCPGGLPSNFGWGNGTSLAQQGAWLSEAVQLSIQTGMVRCVIVWNIDFFRNDCNQCVPGAQDCDPQGSFAIIRPDGSCPTCDALHAVLGTR